MIYLFPVYVLACFAYIHAYVLHGDNPGFVVWLVFIRQPVILDEGSLGTARFLGSYWLWA